MNHIDYKDEKIYPSKVICVGRNYVEHIKELNNEIPEDIVIFNKPNSAISKELKEFDEQIRYEGEISFLIKDDCIQAVGFGLDLTKVEIQNKLKSKGLPWEKAKAFNDSAVFTRFVPFDIKKIEKLKMLLYINDKLVQEASYELMIHKPLDILKDIQSFMSLEDGDIIMSGTPKGVGTYKGKDIFMAKLYCDDELILEESFTVNKRY